jgi:hypothetical protein
MWCVLSMCGVLAACVMQPGYGGYAGGGYANGGMAARAPLPPPGPRTITFNGVAASERDLATLDRLEQLAGARLPSGDYWYDDVSGAAGRWGGPAISILPAGLGLGGPLPANASGGGSGTLTGVFVNGRELHPYDVMVLQMMIGNVYPGRWFADGQGNFGLEGGPVLGNLFVLAQQAQQRTDGNGPNTVYHKDINGSTFIGGGCVSSSSKDATYMGPGC